MISVYSRRDMLRNLHKDLQYELDMLKFYMGSLKDLNYAENKKKIDILVRDTHKHIGWITEEILEVSKAMEAPLKKPILNTALREEQGAQEIYAYQLRKVDRKRVQAMLKKLIADERKHEKLVSSLK